MSDDTRRPFDGIRVLDFSQVLAGPTAAMTLADLGAEVIKVEPTGGDSSRGFKPPDIGGESAFFMCANRNKLGIALDLKSDEGRAAALALAAVSDVVIENTRTGVMERLGLGYEVLKKNNPGLVYCAVSGYGRTGPYATHAGYDPIAQAESGLMAITGMPDGDPTRVGASIIDMVTGLYAAQAITAALYARRDTGQGQFIESTLIGTGVNMLVNFGAQSLITGDNPTRIGNGSQAVQPVGVYDTADGQFMLTIASQPMFRRFCEVVLERLDLIDDPRFADNSVRVENKVVLTAELNAIFATQPTRYWLDRMDANAIPAGEILSVHDGLRSPMVEALGLVQNAPHATLGEVPTLMPSSSLSDTPYHAPVAAPVLGQHTRDVLSRIAGFSEARVEAMIAAGDAVAWEKA